MYVSPISRRFVRVLLLCLGGSIAVSPPLRAQEFVFTKVVDSNDPIPGGGGALFVPADRPALDAGTVIFRNGNTLAPDAIWSVSGGDFTKLVDLNTLVPGGTGKFSSLILDFSAPGYPVLSNGTVIFAGRDSASSGYTGGLYSVPAVGILAWSTFRLGDLFRPATT
jgi:hypothetical protein